MRKTAPADERGHCFMAMVGFDTQPAPVFWEGMVKLSPDRPPEFLSTHADPTKRITNLNRFMPKALEYYNARE